jgi:hypothetical protein
MYSIIQQPGIKKALVFEIPSFFASLICAESFYKFHSFTLECIAFLGTWFVISVVVNKIKNLFQ